MNSVCILYMGDILVHDTNEEDHLKHFLNIFEEIRKMGLKLKLSKCVFYKKHLQY